jgi:REP element-mobilizing transposase RayT
MNKYNPNIHHRKSIRLKGYDYSQAGLYFITICVNRRGNPLWLPFGNIKNGEMMLNDAGRMVENEWLKLPQRFSNIELHEYVVMSNHFHAIIEIVGATLVVAQNDEKKTVAQNDRNEQNNLVQPETVQPENQTVQPENQMGQPQGIAPTAKPKTVGDMVGAFQSIVTVEYIRGVKQHGWQPFNGKLWQRNYLEHIIRDELSYQRISEYIINNPKNWDNDKLNGKY